MAKTNANQIQMDRVNRSRRSSYFFEAAFNSFSPASTKQVPNQNASRGRRASSRTGVNTPRCQRGLFVRHLPPPHARGLKPPVAEGRYLWNDNFLTKKCEVGVQKYWHLINLFYDMLSIKFSRLCSSYESGPDRRISRGKTLLPHKSVNFSCLFYLRFICRTLLLQRIAVEI